MGRGSIPVPHIPTKAGLICQSTLRTEFGQTQIMIGEGAAHLDLTSTALYTIYIIQSNVPLSMESDSFHHIDSTL